MEDSDSEEEQSAKERSVSAANHQGLTNKQVNRICKKPPIEDGSDKEIMRAVYGGKKKGQIQ